MFVTSGDPDSAEQIVLAFDAESGAAAVGEAVRVARLFDAPDNSYATSTPAVDADHLYVLWLDGERVTLAALTHDGHVVWRQQLASRVEPHGFGTSPIVVGDTVCVANETADAERSTVDRHRSHQRQHSLDRAAVAGKNGLRHALCSESQRTRFGC